MTKPAANVKASTGSAQRDSKPDQITILMTTAAYTASKRFAKTVTGIEKIDFNAGYLFGVMKPQPVNNIYELSDVLLAVESFPNMLVIRGLPKDAALEGNLVRRMGSGEVGNFFTPPEGHHWILIDIDKVPLPPRLSLNSSPIPVCEHLVRLLPAEFHDATYHWQMSSSAGIGDKAKVSMHLWFWLRAPIPDLALKTWAKTVNDLVGYKLIDPALFQHVQAHYTAAPIFDGMENPFPERSGLQTKTCDSVDLIIVDRVGTPTARPSPRTETTTNQSTAGSGFEHHLSLIGDHAGGDGFHAPIVASAASYVATHGVDGTDVEVLFAVIRSAVLAADAKGHDRAYVEHMASRDHIVPAITSALKKFGGHAAQPRRKSKIHTGIQPHFKSHPISVAEAQRRLADIANLGL